MPTVLIVDDSSYVRVVFRHLWAERGWRTAVAADGSTALKVLAAIQPDLVTMDVEMPAMDGVQATRALRRAGYRGPVIILSGLTDAAARITIDALAAGADDFVEKPRAPEQAALTVDGLITRYEALSAQSDRPAEACSHGSARTDGLAAVCLAASTGGPSAIATLLSELPRGLPLVVVQHMPPGFTAPFAERLARVSGRSVAEVPADGSPIPWGSRDVLVACGGKHLRLSANEAWSEDGPRRHGVIPAADVTLSDAAHAFGRRLAAVILTGMGEDGAHGARTVHAAGGVVIAESATTAAVWGMPRAAVEAGAVDAVWPLERIRSWLHAVQHAALIT